MTSMKTLDGPKIHLTAQCLDCRVLHEIAPVSPGASFLREMDEWSQKHLGHRIEFFSPKRDIPVDLNDRSWNKIGIAPWWLEHQEFKHNANVKIAYSASSAMTWTSLNSLATSTTLAGASALAVDNTSGAYLDYSLAGLIKNHSSAPAAGAEISIWAYRAYDDTPTYPDTMAGTDAAKTVTTINILYTGFKPVANIVTAATINQFNPFDLGAISALWGGVTPKIWSLWLTHNSGVILNASGHVVSYSGSYITAV